MMRNGYRGSLMLAAQQAAENNESSQSAPLGIAGKSALQLRAEDAMQQAELSKANRAAQEAAGPSYYAPGILKQPDGRLTDVSGATVSDPGELANLQRTKLATLGLNPNNGDAGIAQSTRAFKGYNPNEQSKDEIQASMMRNLGQAISQMPPEDRQIAYERAIGVMAGKGSIQIHDMPEWTKGGQQFMENMQRQKDTQEQIMEGLRNQGKVGAATAKALGKNGLVGSPQVQQNVKDSVMAAINNPATPPLQRNQLISSAKDMGWTGDPGEPVGAPISARAIKTFTAANETLKNTQALSDLFVKNPDMNLFFPKASGAAGGLGNALLSPQAQQYNVLSSHINDAISNMSGDSSIDKNQLKRLSDQLPAVGDDPKTIGTKLAILRDEASNIKSGIDPSGHVERLLSQPALNASQQQAAQPVMNPGQPPSPQQAPQQATQMDPVQEIMKSHPQLSPQQAAYGFQQMQKAAASQQAPQGMLAQASQQPAPYVQPPDLTDAQFYGQGNQPR